VLADFTQEIAEALHFPPDCIGSVLLVLAASAIGASRALDLHPHFRERPALYLAVVLPSGLTLTSVLQILAEPIFQTQAKWLGARRKTAEDIQRQMDEWIKRYSETDALDEVEDESLALGQYEWTKLKRWFATDANAGALAVLLKDNHRGLLILRDDLAPWLKALESRDGLREREFFAAGWSGTPLCLDRRLPGNGRHRPIMIPSPFLCLIGHLNADHLGVMNSLSSRLVHQFLFAFPDPWPNSKWRPQTIAEDGRLLWQAILDNLRDLQPERKNQSRLVRLDAEAARAWAGLYDSIADRLNSSDPHDHFPGQAKCWHSYAARLALVLHFLWWAADYETAEDPRSDRPCEQIEVSTIERTARLVDYFQAHARKARASLGAPARLDQARMVLRWLSHSGRNRFSRRDAHYALRSRFHTVQQLEPVLNTLVQHGFFRPVWSDPRPGPGRQPSPVYEVNPLWQKETERK
jgi:hypothetical protein